MNAVTLQTIVLALLVWTGSSLAVDTLVSDSATGSQLADSMSIRLSKTVTLSDTIPPDFFDIVDNLGLNGYTARLISRYRNIPDSIVLEALARSDMQTEVKFINAYIVAQALDLFCKGDDLWTAFFSDIERQLREPNILRFNFRDDQKWKSYALDELFYSTFFQELLLVMGNIGFEGARDGKQWLAGWPDPLRWKYREYRFEYMPEDIKVQLIRNARAGTDSLGPEATGTVRIQPLDQILPLLPGDTVEPALPRPHF